MNPFTAPAYLNGVFTTVGECRIDVLDRGFLFGDGVYEVIPVYNGVMFEWPAHFARLERSLHETRIPAPCSCEEWEKILNGLISRAGDVELSLYLQVTRGVAPRDHHLTEPVTPTVFAMATPLAPVSAETFDKGVSVVTGEDIRWHRCDIKMTSLIGNVLLKTHAVESGVYDVILLRHGRITEGSSSNVFLVRDGVLITAVKDQWILPGITRDVLIRIAGEKGVEVQERVVMADEIKAADEIWLSSSTKEILPVTRVDGAPVGDGVPGSVWRDFSVALKALT